MIYGGDEEERKEVEADESAFAVYKGMDGPREVAEEVVEGPSGKPTGTVFGVG